MTCANKYIIDLYVFENLIVQLTSDLEKASCCI